MLEKVTINLEFKLVDGEIKTRVNGSVFASQLFFMTAIIEAQKAIYNFYLEKQKRDSEDGRNN